ncbi:TetR family transcriptional regulator [Scopulibacillus darangshiensis]|uniref:TetR family transcriptional regulator n=1 Tax=Scopulibacillus darangshiensis TaxID=442528 RepID=A0A4R2PCC0_9BACL|nr:forespore capture DNA-binding protein RefZ [Scopulibacillus darangshiensis]TCP32048.1 TetR family transcriptional regulator [Scopulibacillus darangshiensis]
MVQKSKGQQTKEEVITSAVKLFNMNGYSGTSIRAIAKEAGVNIALVSYYFGGKSGLLEHLMSTFLEGYIQTLEEAFQETDLEKEKISGRLMKIADRLIAYQQDCFYLSRFVHREMTLDTVLVRELMATYLMKEKYLLEKIFLEAAKRRQIRKIPVDLLVMQYRDMIIMPFLQPQYIRKVFFLQPNDGYFRRSYLKFIEHWVGQILKSHDHYRVNVLPHARAY